MIILTFLAFISLCCEYKDRNGNVRIFPDSVNGLVITVTNPNPFPIKILPGPSSPNNGLFVSCGMAQLDQAGGIVVPPAQGYSKAGREVKITIRPYGGFGNFSYNNSYYYNGQLSLRAYPYNPDRDEVWGQPAIQWFSVPYNDWSFATWDPGLPTPPDMVPPPAQP